MLLIIVVKLRLISPTNKQTNKKQQHLLSIYCVSDTVLHALNASSLFILTVVLRDGYYFYTHFIGEETKAQELGNLLGITPLVNVEWD